MGGEKHPYTQVIKQVQGSPPHGRGKGLLAVGFCTLYRITPAWAGKRLLDFVQAMSQMDHPRMGGEKQRNAILQKKLQGSPPHGRGKVYMDGNRQTLRRITPAWAGKRLYKEL